MSFIKSLIYITLVLFGLVAILNVLGELEFFKNINVKTYFPLYLAVLNSPSFIFEMFPFIFLLSTQVFFFQYIGKQSNTNIQIFRIKKFTDNQDN